jgi:hypothetical protein
MLLALVFACSDYDLGTDPPEVGPGGTTVIGGLPGDDGGGGGGSDGGGDGGGGGGAGGGDDDGTIPDDGCTGTVGYWANHPELWPVDHLLLGDRDYGFDALQGIFALPVAGDVSIQLASQLIAAKLGVAGGATDAGVAAAIDDADLWLIDHDDADGIPLDVHTDADGSDLIDDLATWNEGSVTGPDHC